MHHADVIVIISSSVGWQAGRLGWLTGWLISWLTCWVVFWFVDKLTD